MLGNQISSLVLNEFCNCGQAGERVSKAQKISGSTHVLLQADISKTSKNLGSSTLKLGQATMRRWPSQRFACVTEIRNAASSSKYSTS